MKKSYSWQILLILLAVYLILLAFFPSLNIIFDYFKLTLLIALGFLWLGTEHRNPILFFTGLAFSAVYIDEVLPYGRIAFNIAPLFLGLLVLGLAVHSINRKRHYQKMVEFQANHSTVISNDAEYLNVDANFTEQYEYSNATALKSISVKAFLGRATIDLTGAQFDKPLTYVTIKQTASTTILRVPKSVSVINGLKSGLGEVYLPPHNQQSTHQLYLTGSNILSKVSIQYVE